VLTSGTWGGAVTTDETLSSLATSGCIISLLAHISASLPNKSGAVWNPFVAMAHFDVHLPGDF
jgi:hypothetical protein